MFKKIILALAISSGLALTNVNATPWSVGTFDSETSDGYASQGEFQHGFSGLWWMRRHYNYESPQALCAKSQQIRRSQDIGQPISICHSPSKTCTIPLGPTFGGGNIYDVLEEAGSSISLNCYSLSPQWGWIRTDTIWASMPARSTCDVLSQSGPGIQLDFDIDENNTSLSMFIDSGDWHYTAGGWTYNGPPDGIWDIEHRYTDLGGHCSSPDPTTGLSSCGETLTYSDLMSGGSGPGHDGEVHVQISNSETGSIYIKQCFSFDAET